MNNQINITNTNKEITKDKAKGNSSYITDLEVFKSGLKSGLTAKEMIEEFSKHNIFNP
jgi:hypothetical protein